MRTIVDDVHDKVVHARNQRAKMGMDQPEVVYLSPIVYKAVKRQLEAEIRETAVEIDEDGFILHGVTIRERPDMPAVKIR